MNAYDTEEDKAGQAAYSAAAFAKGAISSHFKPLFVTLQCEFSPRCCRLSSRCVAFLAILTPCSWVDGTELTLEGETGVIASFSPSKSGKERGPSYAGIMSVRLLHHFTSIPAPFLA